MNFLHLVEAQIVVAYFQNPHKNKGNKNNFMKEIKNNNNMRFTEETKGKECLEDQDM